MSEGLELPRANAVATTAKRINTVLLLTIAALAGLVAIYVRVRLLNVPLDRDEGEYAYIGQLLLQGVAPFVDAYNIKLPGTAMMYSVFMAAFGQTPLGIHAGLLVVNVAVTWLLWVLARDIFDVRTATACAVTYVTLSLGSGVLGVFAQATQFVNLWVLAGFVVLLRQTRRVCRSSLYISGLLFGLAVLTKQHAALLAFYGLAIVVCQANDEGVSFRALIRRCIWYMFGATTPIALLLAWVISAGAFDRFWTWTVVYAGIYAADGSILDGLKVLYAQTMHVSARSWPFWVLAVAGVGALFLRGGADWRSRGFVAGLFVASFLAICPGLYFRDHYFVLMLPSIALLAGHGLVRVADLTFANWSDSAKALVWSALLLTALNVTYFLDRAYLFQDSPLEVSHGLYPMNPFRDSSEIAKYIESNSAADERVAILGSEPQIPFYAKRRSATGHIYMYLLMQDQPYADAMQRDMIAELEAARPRFLVFANVQSSWSLLKSSPRRIFHWVDDYVEAGYELAGIVEFGFGESRYTWGADTIGYTPRSENYVSIWKRTTKP